MVNITLLNFKVKGQEHRTTFLDTLLLRDRGFLLLADSRLAHLGR